MAEEKLLNLAIQVGLLDQETLNTVGAHSDVFEKVGLYARLAYETGLADGTPTIEMQVVQPDDSEEITFKMNGEVLCTMNRDDHSRGGMEAAKNLFIAVAKKLGLEVVDE